MIDMRLKRREERRARRLAAMAAAALGMVAASPAAAGSCLEEVNALAAAEHLAVDPPNAKGAPPTPGEGPEDLAKSGGVIEPPKVDDPAVIDPPGGVRYGMPTMPDVPSNAPPPGANGTGTPLSPQDTAILETFLVAARAEAKRGNEADCFRKLDLAKQYLAERK
jgi:hypothetical protein